MVQNTDKKLSTKKERRRRRKVSPDVYFASAVRTVFDYLLLTDSIPDLIKFNPKIREGSGAPERWIIQRLAE